MLGEGRAVGEIKAGLVMITELVGTHADDASDWLVGWPPVAGEPVLRNGSAWSQLTE